MSAALLNGESTRKRSTCKSAPLSVRRIAADVGGTVSSRLKGIADCNEVAQSRSG